MKRLFSIGSFLLFTMGLVGGISGSANDSKSSGELTLPKVEQVLPGKTTKQEVTQLLGKPTNVLHLKALPASSETGESWKYENNDRRRLSILFAENADAVDSWIWTVREGEAERDLRRALNHYPGASWQADTVKWINPHAFPSECYFKNENQGVTVEWNRNKKTVSSIMRWNPASKRPSPTDDKPPRFCIDGHCVDGIPSKVWMKKWEPCLIPK